MTGRQRAALSVVVLAMFLWLAWPRPATREVVAISDGESAGAIRSTRPLESGTSGLEMGTLRVRIGDPVTAEPQCFNGRVWARCRGGTSQEFGR